MRVRLTVALVFTMLLVSCSTPPAPREQASVSASPEVAGAVSDSVAFASPRTWHYLVTLPQGYEMTKESWPLVVFLHGSGERGTDLQKVAVHGPPKLVAEGKSFPFILVSPQCPPGLLWSGPEVDEFVAQICKRYRVDTKRVYLTGLSMGGYGVWEAAIYNPGRYAALVPICGGGYAYDLAAKLKDIPIWAFHGAKDLVVPIRETQRYVAIVLSAGGQAKLTVYPDAGHDSWTETYANPELYEWMLAQSRH